MEVDETFLTFSDQVFINGSEEGTTRIYREWAIGPVNCVLVTTTGVLSMLGTLLIIITYVLWRDIRTTSRRILVFLSIADFFVACGNLTGLWSVKQSTTDICVVQSYVTSTANLMSYMWSVCLATYLYISLVKRRQATAEKLIPLFHIVCWVPGIAINTGALIDGALGNTADALTGGWCWIRYYPDGTFKHRLREIFWMLIDGQFWLISACVTSFVLYAIIKLKTGKEIRRQSLIPQQHGMMKAAKAADRKLILIPFLFVIVRIWGMIRFLLFVLRLLPNEKGAKQLDTLHKFLLTLQGVGDSAQGCVNCILFCFFTPKVCNHLKNAARHAFHCCRNRSRRSSSPAARFYNQRSSDPATRGSEASIADDHTSLLDSGRSDKKTYGSA